jgi:membrane-bound lytic murein transglycosylase D
MDTVQRSTSFCLLFFLLAVLSACSPLTTAHRSAGIDPDSYGDAEEIQAVPVEPEEELAEELAGLEKLGDWSSTPIPLQEQEVTTVYDFPVTINKQVEFYLDLFQNRQKKYFKRWLARSGKYLPAISHELRAAGLPQDLAYLAMIESGYNPSAYSHAHAAGLWQFISSTGRNYGLRIDSWGDERRDPEKATKAAAAYLKALYKRFGDWHFAVAAYNAGEGKIERGIKKYQARDFWDLARHNYLRLETKRYVPKLIAAIIIARNPEKYGFTNIAYEEPADFDLIKVPGGTDLRAVAVSGSMTLKELRLLNNELRKNQTPPSGESYVLKIPAGTRKLVAANLSRLHPVVTTAYKTHKVARGDTLARISKRYQISRTTLLKANKLRSSRLKIGQHLRIPYKTRKYVLLEKGQKVKDYYAAANTADSPMVLHELRRGETLSRVSHRYNVPVELIMEWNNISDVRKVRVGRKLAIYPTGGTRVASAGKQADDGKVVMLSDVKKRRSGASAKAASRVSYYRVRHGDSLWSIAKKFQVSTRDIRRWNGMRDNTIHPGTRLIIKKS